VSKNGMRPVHPGEVLLEEYLRPLGTSLETLARALNLEPKVLEELVCGRRGVDADLALRFSRYFGGDESDAQGWMHLQAAYDLKQLRHANETACAQGATDTGHDGEAPPTATPPNCVR
jgi:addiction module HigA family antidote